MAPLPCLQATVLITAPIITAHHPRKKNNCRIYPVGSVFIPNQPWTARCFPDRLPEEPKVSETVIQPPTEQFSTLQNTTLSIMALMSFRETTAFIYSFMPDNNHHDVGPVQAGPIFTLPANKPFCDALALE